MGVSPSIRQAIGSKWTREPLASGIAGGDAFSRETNC